MMIIKLKKARVIALTLPFVIKQIQILRTELHWQL